MSVSGLTGCIEMKSDFTASANEPLLPPGSVSISPVGAANQPTVDVSISSTPLLSSQSSRVISDNAKDKTEAELLASVVESSNESRNIPAKTGAEASAQISVELKIKDEASASDSQLASPQTPFNKLIDLPLDVADFSKRAQDFLKETGLTIQDLVDAKIRKEKFEQLLDASVTKRLLRWIALESLLQKAFLFPLLDERGIQNEVIISKNPNCCPATLEWLSSRTWPKAQSIPFKSETMARRAYAMDDFFDGIESVITRVWTLLLGTFLANDYYNYYAYPEERYGATPARILFNQGDNEQSLVTYLSRPEHWYGFVTLLGIPLGWGLIKALRTSLCCPPSTDAKKLKELQAFFNSYKAGGLCEDICNWVIPFSIARNTLDATRQILLWNNQISAEQRLALYQAFQAFSRRAKKLAQLYSFDLLSDIADGIAMADLCRLARLGEEPKVLKFLLANKAQALEELQAWARYYQPISEQGDRSYYGRFLRPLAHYLTAQYLLWCLGQPHSTLLQPLFWVFKAGKLLVKANFAYLIYKGIEAAIALYYLKQDCEWNGKYWGFINEIGDYNCTVCADFPIPYPYTFTMRSCLDNFLRTPRNTSEIIRLLDRAQTRDNITVLDLSNQHFSDVNGTNDLIPIMPVIQRQISTLTTFIYNFSITAPTQNFPIGLQGAKAIAAFLPASNLKLLDLTNNEIGDKGAIFLAEILPNSKLQTLNLGYNNIRASGAVAIGEGLKHSTLQTLDLTVNNLGDSGAIAIGGGLNSSALQTLLLGGNNIGASGAAAIGGGLNSSALQALNLRKNNIGDSGAAAIGGGLKHSTLQTLDLWGNNIGASGAAAIGEGLKHSTLQTLDLYGNNIGDSGAAAIGEGLKNSTLQTLDLGHNNIGSSGAAAIGGGLKNSTLQTLGLGHNNIGSSGAAAIGGGLKNSTLQTLGLDYNNIGASGAAAIGAGLNSSDLQTLDLYGNNIGDSGAIAIGGGLNSSALQTLLLGINNIGDSGAAAIGEGLKNSTLQTLDLGVNNIGDTGAAAIGGGLKYSALQTLYLGFNNIGASGAAAIGEGLKHSTLQTLGLGYNNIGDSGAVAIGGGLYSSALQTLNLEVNNIEDSGAAAIGGGLKHSTLQTLDLWGNNIGASGAAAIGGGLNSSALQTLNLYSNNIGDSGAAAIGGGLKHSTLQILDLHLNNIGDSGAQAIADNLITPSKNDQHRLWINLLDPKDKPIQEMPKSNTRLISLSLKSNHINNSSSEILCQELPWTSMSVSSLNLGENNVDHSIVDQNGFCVTSGNSSLRPSFLNYLLPILLFLHFAIRFLHLFGSNNSNSNNSKDCQNFNLRSNVKAKGISSSTKTSPQKKFRKDIETPITKTKNEESSLGNPAISETDTTSQLMLTAYKMKITSGSGKPCATKVTVDPEKENVENEMTNKAIDDFSTYLNSVQKRAKEQCSLALELLYGKNSKRDKTRALDLLISSVKLGNVEAMHEIGDCYLSGTGFNQNDKKAAEWFTLAARRGYVPAQLQMGYLYQGGYGVEKNQEAALDWFRLAGEAGSSCAQFEVNQYLRTNCQKKRFG